MKKLIALLVLAALVFSLAACGGGEEAAGDLEYVIDKGTMVIGYTVYEPMNFTDDDGNFTGFDTELATIVSERLGVEPEFIEINWDTKEVELGAKSIDCIWNGLTITPGRQAEMEITNPYVKNAQVILVKSGTEYDGPESLADKTLVAEQGSAGEEVIFEDDYLSQATYAPKSVQTDCLLELKAGTADAAVLDLTLAKAMTGPGTSYQDIEIVDYMAEEFYGVAFRKGSDLCEAVNELFVELIEDGTMDALAEKYGLELAN